MGRGAPRVMAKEDAVKERTRLIVGGAAVGAVAGALVAWLVARRGRPAADEEGTARAVIPLDRGRLIRLGAAVVGVVRQVLELE